MNKREFKLVPRNNRNIAQFTIDKLEYAKYPFEQTYIGGDIDPRLEFFVPPSPPPPPTKPVVVQQVPVPVPVPPPTPPPPAEPLPVPPNPPVEDTAGVQNNLYTYGGEYLKPNGNEYIGPYHIHPDKGAMVGAQHVAAPHSILTPIPVSTGGVKPPRPGSDIPEIEVEPPEDWPTGGVKPMREEPQIPEYPTG